MLLLLRAAALSRAHVRCDARTECGGLPLKPQGFPPFLDGYHEQTLKYTEAVFADPSIAVARAVPYGPASHQTLDVYSPESGGGGMPIVFGIHGGGWEYGYKEWTGFLAANVCRTGAVYITPAYTLGEGERQAWPASRDDLLQALRWVSAHGAEHGGDPSKLVLTGHSAGGHYASCLGLNPSLLQAAGLDATAIKALFLVSCPLGLRAEDFALNRWLWRLWLGRPLVWLLYSKVAPNLRAVVGAPPDPRTAADASALVSVLDADLASLPPYVHITYGLKGDFPFCGPQARRLRKLLARRGANSAAGPKLDVLELAGAGHFDTHYAAADSESEWSAALRRTLSEMV
jgi:acetyl esterase/lipase